MRIEASSADQDKTVELSDPDIVYITLSNGTRFTLGEAYGALEVLGRHLIFVQPRAANHLYLYDELDVIGKE